MHILEESHAHQATADQPGLREVSGEESKGETPVLYRSQIYTHFLWRSVPGTVRHAHAVTPAAMSASTPPRLYPTLSRHPPVPPH
jgi:hypothetical protein